MSVGCYLCEPVRPSARADDDTWDEACDRCDFEFWLNPVGIILEAEA